MPNFHTHNEKKYKRNLEYISAPSQNLSDADFFNDNRNAPAKYEHSKMNNLALIILFKKCPPSFA